MDPLLLEVLRFGTAILAGGIVAVVAQRLAFDHARRLQGEDRTHRRASALAALAQEVEENIVRTGDVEETTAPIRITRSAWDAARGIDLGPDASEKLRRAYALGEDLNSRIATVDAFAATPIVGAEGANAEKVRSDYLNTLIDASHVIADKTRKAFVRARKALANDR